MPPAKTKFSATYKTEFPFLKSDPSDEYNAICVTCKTTFSIQTGGRSSITKHANTKKHIEATKVMKNCAPLDGFIKTTEDRRTAANELGYTYHVAKHGISFKSTECSSPLFQSMFDPKFCCSRVKTAALSSEKRNRTNNH